MGKSSIKPQNKAALSIAAVTPEDADKSISKHDAGSDFNSLQKVVN